MNDASIPAECKNADYWFGMYPPMMQDEYNNAGVSLVVLEEQLDPRTQNMTLKLFADVFEEQDVIDWLKIHLGWVNTNTSCATKLDMDTQIEPLAKEIFRRFPGMTMASMMVAFSRMKNIHFYNAVDAGLILEFMEEFRQKVNNEVFEYEKREAEEKAARRQELIQKKNNRTLTKEDIEEVPMTRDEYRRYTYKTTGKDPGEGSLKKVTKTFGKPYMSIKDILANRKKFDEEHGVLSQFKKIPVPEGYDPNYVDEEFVRKRDRMIEKAWKTPLPPPKTLSPLSL